MQDSRRPRAPQDPTHDSPRPGNRPGPEAGGVRLAAAGAGLAVLASALVVGDVLATAVGVALALAGIVMGIVALVRSRRTSGRGLLIAFAVIAIFWGALNALGGGSRLLVWPATQAYQECTDRALTLSSSRHCEQQLTDNVWHHFSGTPLETGAPTGEPSPTGSASPSGTTTPQSSSSASPAVPPTAASPTPAR